MKRRAFIVLLTGAAAAWPLAAQAQSGRIRRARPGGNITGFVSHRASMGGEWVEALKETAPHITRTLAIMHPETLAHQGAQRTR